MRECASDFVSYEIYVLDVINDEIINISNNVNAIDTKPRWQPKKMAIPDGPDLVVVDGGVSTSSDGLSIKITFKISNIGSEASTLSRVYINAINTDIPEPSYVNQIRKQEDFQSLNLGLAKKLQRLLVSSLRKIIINWKSNISTFWQILKTVLVKPLKQIMS